MSQSRATGGRDADARARVARFALQLFVAGTVGPAMLVLAGALEWAIVVAAFAQCFALWLGFFGRRFTAGRIAMAGAAIVIVTSIVVIQKAIDDGLAERERAAERAPAPTANPEGVPVDRPVDVPEAGSSLDPPSVDSSDTVNPQPD